jgi:SAM-dependent methyltransferase
MKLTQILAQEVVETLKRPSRLLHAANPRRLASFLKFQRLRLTAGGPWSGQGEGALATRKMNSYDDYIRLQQSKLQYLDLASHEGRFRKALRERTKEFGLLSRGTRVLCLGARLGAEVAAFRDLGAFAVGVDLNPGTDNPWVLYGDFHHLEYPDGCLDLVYSNSLDHCLEPQKVLAEVRRLLRPDGHFLVEADPGEQDPNGAEPDMWATFQWKTVESLREMVEGQGFVLASKAGFDYPRNGTALLFALDSAWE